MHIVLLSGGSGKRLWPLSNDSRSKQFIKLFRNEEGVYESMVQRVYHQLKKLDRDIHITIATSANQLSAIHNQLGEEVSISIEPCRRDTFPAIALATAYLHDRLGASSDEVVVVCPVDPYVEAPYFEALKRLGELAAEGGANLSLLGMTPTYPSEKYGYIIPATNEPVSPVLSFKEKPTQQVAEEYIQKGGLWNGGVFAYKVGYMLDKAHEQIDFVNYTDLYAKYDKLKKISFDYAVVEKEPSIQVMRFEGTWLDLGTWNTLTDVMTDRSMGLVSMDETCENVHVINEMDVPVLCMGLKNTVVAASAEGILISEKDRSAHIKSFVDAMNHPVMFAEKSWGIYHVLDCQPGSMTVRLEVMKDHSMSYHSHQLRGEVWTVVAGRGEVIKDGDVIPVAEGSIVGFPPECKHTIKAYSDMKIIEVQIGDQLLEEDKKTHRLKVKAAFERKYELL